jgi:hypothetical protein
MGDGHTRERFREPRAAILQSGSPPGVERVHASRTSASAWTDLRFSLFTHSNAKRFHFALAAFIKPVVATYNLSSLMLGSSRLPFYSPVSFVSGSRMDLLLTLCHSSLGGTRLASRPTTSRAKTEQEKAPSRNTRNSGYRGGLVSYSR